MEPLKTPVERADAALTSLLEELPEGEAALLLATLLNRSATRLHNLARASAGARRGTPEWTTWAALQNAARAVTLQAATCRDLANRAVAPRS